MGGENVREIKKEHIVKIHDKEHVTYEGLLSMATDDGLESIEVDIIQYPCEENKNTCVCKATAKCKDSTFTDIGDANPDNVNPMISKHIIRMASTRAKARALRDMLNIGMCVAEELDADTPKPVPQKPRQTGNPARHNTQSSGNIICEGCNKAITKSGSHTPEQIASYSNRLYGKPLCKACQKKVEAAKK